MGIKENFDFPLIIVNVICFINKKIMPGKTDYSLKYIKINCLVNSNIMKKKSRKNMNQLLNHRFCYFNLDFNTVTSH